MYMYVNCDTVHFSTAPCTGHGPACPISWFCTLVGDSIGVCLPTTPHCGQTPLSQGAPTSLCCWRQLSGVQVCVHVGIKLQYKDWAIAKVVKCKGVHLPSGATLQYQLLLTIFLCSMQSVVLYYNGFESNGLHMPPHTLCDGVHILCGRVCIWDDRMCTNSERGEGIYGVGCTVWPLWYNVLDYQSALLHKYDLPVYGSYTHSHTSIYGMYT